jgi:hypothetical protein
MYVICSGGTFSQDSSTFAHSSDLTSPSWMPDTACRSISDLGFPLFLLAAGLDSFFLKMRVLEGEAAGLKTLNFFNFPPNPPMFQLQLTL